MNYRIPHEDLSKFYALPAEVQRDVRLMLEILGRINGTARGVHARIAAEARAVHRRGFSKQSIGRKRSLYKESGGNWAVLVDAARAPGWDAVSKRCDKGGGRKLPFAFVEYWKSVVDENHRKTKPAWRELVRRWRAGVAVPGYGTWQEWFLRETEGACLPSVCPPDLPEGWSYRSLCRYKPPKEERALTQRGIQAARLELPSVIGTREGIRFAEWIVLDDWRSDFRVLDPRSERPVQLNGILALDVGSAMALRFGLRPQVPRADGTEEGLKRRDAKAIVAGILATYGYPEDYVCNIIVERGTATIPPDDAAAVEEITEGHVKIHYTSMISGSVFGFADRPLGNFLGKAWLESYFNLVHNEAAALPGQIGARYDLAPQSTDVKMREAATLVQAGKFLRPEVRRELHFPFMSPGEARVSLEHIFRRLNRRTDHELEAFAQVMEWREARMEQWRPAHEALGMPPAVQDMLLWRRRNESPWERAQRLREGCSFRQLHPSCLPRVLEEHKRVTCDKPGELVAQIRGKRQVYIDLDSPHLAGGAEFLAYYDGENPEWLHLTDGRGAYVCSVRQARAVQRHDHKALAEEIRGRQAKLNATLENVRRRNSDKLSNRARELEDNQRLLAEAAEAEEAINLVPVPAGEQADGAPAFARQIDQVAAAQQAIAAQQARTEDRVRRARGDLDDIYAFAGRSESDADHEEQEERNWADFKQMV